jgi:patatin-like phospholipase/acyl hydrolase
MSQLDSDSPNALKSIQPVGRPFQVLALDGGGYRGMFSARVLEHWEAQLGHPIIDCFDLIVGTSTGGIIALGLAAGLPASELVGFYEEDGRKLFPAKGTFRNFWANIRHWARVKYDADELEKALKAKLPPVTLGDLRKPVVIPSFNLEAGKHWYFKTPHFENNTLDAKRQLWEVARATSAAPTYFPAFRSSNSESFIDGGVLANNPSLVGYFEVLLNFPESIGNLRILNLGTEGCESALPNERLARGGLLAWAKPAPNVLMKAQAVSTEKLMERVLGSERWMRVKPEHGRDFAPLDIYAPEVYKGLGTSEAARQYSEANRKFFGHKAKAELVRRPQLQNP